MNKNKFITIGLVVGLVVASTTLLFTYRRFMSTTGYSSKVEIPKDLSSVNVATMSQPTGYGVKRKLTGELKTEPKKSMGDIDFNGVGEETFQIIGKLAEDKEKIYSLVKKKDKYYTSTIDWTEPKNLTIDDYKALMVACGQITEDELNKDQIGRYTVETNIPESESLKEAGLDVLFDVDDDGYLTLWADVITRDSKESNEIEELKSYTVYYDGNVLKIK